MVNRSASRTAGRLVHVRISFVSDFTAHLFSSSATCATGSMTLFSSGFTSHGRTKPLPFFLNRSSNAVALLRTLSRSAYLPLRNHPLTNDEMFWGER